MEKLVKKLEFDGYVAIEKYFSDSDLEGFQPALEAMTSCEDADLYNDRSGNLRRLEQFTKKSSFFSELDERVRELLKDITGSEYFLFKDKINFKPPGGEGFHAHYDGIFRFYDGAIMRDGWYEYSDAFINVLIAIDDFTIENGALEVAKVHDGSFDELLKNTKQDGSPDLIDDVVAKCEFTPVLVKKGGL